MEHVLQVLVLYDTHFLINVYRKIFFFGIHGLEYRYG